MPTGYYRGFDERDYLLQGSPSATFAESFPHDQITTDLVASLVTGVLTTVAVPLIAGDIITKVSICSGATAASVTTHCFMALYSPAGVLLQQSADVTSQALAANTVLTHTLAAAVPVATTGVYYAGIGWTATTVPTLIGKVSGFSAAVIAAINAAPIVLPALAQNSGSAIGATAPGTIATPTTQIPVPWVALT